jgi:Scavenger receptor cysteine-rich domain
MNFLLVGDVRLVDGPSYAEGRLEVFYSGFGIWGTVCDDNFQDVDAGVACRSMNQGFVSKNNVHYILEHFALLVITAIKITGLELPMWWYGSIPGGKMYLSWTRRVFFFAQVNRGSQPDRPVYRLE